MKTYKKNLILLLIAIVIVIIPLVFVGDSEFDGADYEATMLANEINPDFEPVVEPLWEPPSGEIESLLFSVQVAIGAGAIGYALGLFRGKSKSDNN